MWTDGVPVQGGQVVGRVAAVLRVIADSSDGRASTTAVARATGLTRPTVHRLLTSLAGVGFVDHDPSHPGWRLGPELYVLGSIATQRHDIAALAAPFVRQLAAATGESAFFSARRGDETVCLLREEGSFPLRSFVLYPGVRFPLGVASAGMAIIAYLPDDEVSALLARSDLPEPLQEPHTRGQVLRRIVDTRRTGWALNPGLLVPGSYGMGAAVFDPAGRAEWALSITGVESRFGRDRVPELGRTLLGAAHEITKAIPRRER